MIAIALYILGTMLSWKIWSFMIENEDVLSSFNEEQLKSISENKTPIKLILSFFWPILAIVVWVF